MSSWFPSWSDKIKKKVGRYLLQRYLGQFLDQKLDLDQLNVEVTQGKGSVYDVTLSSEALNELCEAQGWGVEVMSGHIGSVAVAIPWSALMTQDTNIEVADLSLCIRPRARQTDGITMLESMWSSMSSSMQLAQDCLEKEGDIQPNAQNTTFEGLEKFAQTIDSVLNRIKAKFFNLEVRVELLPPNSDKGIALIIKIEKLEYQNEASGDTVEKSPTVGDFEYDEAEKTHLLSSYATHYMCMEGITFYTEEFRVVDTKCNTESVVASQQFYSTISQLPENEQNSDTEKPKRTPYADPADSDISETESLDDSQEPLVFQSKKVLCAKMTGKQELRVKMKQTVEIAGPKVHLELSLGAINILLSPRQLHLILAFYDAFLKDESVDQAKCEANARHHRQMMDQRPRELELEKANMQRRFTAMSGGVGLNQGFWSDPADDSNRLMSPSSQQHYNPYFQHHQQQQPHYHEEFMAREFSRPYTLSESVMSSNSSMTSSVSSTISSSVSKPRRRFIDADPNADISHFSIHVSSLAFVLLHEEILVECSLYAEAPLSEQSVAQLISVSDKFFGNVDAIFGDSQQRELLEISQFIDENCSNNHLRLILTPIIASGEERRNLSGNILKITSSAARADFREVLQDVSIPLIEFVRDEIMPGLPKRPEIGLTLKQTSPMIRASSGRRAGPPKSEIKFSLLPCLVELDISLYDRLNAILAASPFNLAWKRSPSEESCTAIEAKTDLYVDATAVDLRLRFPIVDSRPIHNPDRVPWWKQNVRPDFLLFKFDQFKLNYRLPSFLDISGNEINIFYCENLNIDKVHIGRTILQDNGESLKKRVGVEYPRITLDFPSNKELRSVLRKNSEDSETIPSFAESIGAKLFSNRTKESSPFSSKRVCRESDTPHFKQYSEDTETLIIPGDSEELKTFCDNAMRTSKVQIKVTLPVISVQINSKHLYEIIYNRINNDLLMWQPNDSSPPTRAASLAPNPINLLNVGMMDSIYAPLNIPSHDINCETSSSTEETETEGESDNVYYSIYDRMKNKRPIETTDSAATSSCSFHLEIDRGTLTLFAPVRDAQSRVIPCQLGEFIFRIRGLYVFSVSGYQSNENLNYVCVEGKGAELYHCGLIPDPLADLVLREVGSAIPSYVQSTIYPSPKDISLTESFGFDEREMLSLAIQIKVIPDQRVKRIRVAAGIQNTTLRHNPALSQHTWLNQLIDIFDVMDYPIEGYTPYGVVTEMHLHLWDCEIDYRPLYLPYRAIATLGSFMISSNISTAAPGCTLRFVAEDSALCLAPYKPTKADKKKYPDNKVTALPSSDLVSILDLGLFEISLRLNDTATELFPKFDLRAGINELHIRTCSDSCRALGQLIAYIAAEGDLIKEEDDNSTTASICSKGDVDLLSVQKPTPNVPEVSPLQQHRVNTLISDAMREPQKPVEPELEDDDEENYCYGQGVEVFFFPDETSLPKVKCSHDSARCRHGSQSSFSKSTASPETVIHVDQKSDGASSESPDNSDYLRNRRRSEDTESDNTELRDLMNFETSVMTKSYMIDDDVAEALPQVKQELGEVSSPSKQPTIPQRKISSDTDDEFCIIGDEEKALSMRSGNEEVEVSEDPLRIVDNHFSIPIGKQDLLKAPPGFPMAVMRYTLCEMSVTWHLYGGNDFPIDGNKDVDDNRSHVRFSDMPMSDAYKMGVSYSKGSPNVQFGKKPVSKLSWKTRGGRGRNHDILMEFVLNKVRFSHEVYPNQTKQASRQVLIISEFEILDKLQISSIKKFLYHPKARHRTKKASQHMVVIKALHIRPDPILTTQECCLRISCLNLRLNIDQDSLLFLVQFFMDLGASSDDNTEIKKKSSTVHQPPVMMVEDLPEAVQDLHARKMVSENLMLLMDEEEKTKDTVEPAADVADNSPIYFKEVEFGPDVLIRLDYHGKRIELSRGPLAGLLMGLGQLQCSEIKLKTIRHRHGILGAERLCNFVLQEWLQDIKKNQLPSLLSGVGPMQTLLQLFQGIRDLFWLPIEQYQKDGRFVRGLQLGAQSFTARTALAALEITTRLIQLLQFTAETAYDMVSPGPSIRRYRGKKGKKKRMHPPQDIREGVANAYQIVRDGIGDTAHTLVEVTAIEHDQKGYTGAVGAVVRQIPPIVVRPIVLATQATSNVLGGVKNQLVPEARIESREKWKEDEE